MSVLLKVDVTNPAPDLTLTDARTVTQQSTGYVFKRKWKEGDTDDRFEDNGDGTVTDHKTGLVWLQNANAFDRKNWNNAVVVGSTLNGTRSSEEGQWRLPTLAELKSLCFDDSGGFIKPGAPFTSVRSYRYWSSSTNSGATASAWCVNLKSGLVDSYDNAFDYYYVWPVRGGQ